MMTRRSLVCLAVAALAVAIVLGAADPASAQTRRAFSGGYTPWMGSGSGYGYGYTNPYYGGYNPWYGGSNSWYGGSNPWQYSSGYGTGMYSSGWRNNPGYYSNYPGYYSTGGSTPDYRWSGSEYAGYAPSYYGESRPGDYYSSGTGYGSSTGSYGAFSGTGTDNDVLITVRVPPNAEVWVDDQKTSQTGSIRTFVSPPLDSDGNFVYHLRARWTENGQQVEKNRRVDVHAGDRFFVNFMKPRSEGMRGSSPGQTGEESQAPSGDRSLERSDRTLENQNRNRTDNADRAPNKVTPENRSRPVNPDSEKP